MANADEQSGAGKWALRDALNRSVDEKDAAIKERNAIKRVLQDLMEERGVPAMEHILADLIETVNGLYGSINYLDVPDDQRKQKKAVLREISDVVDEAKRYHAHFKQLNLHPKETHPIKLLPPPPDKHSL